MILDLWGISFHAVVVSISIYARTLWTPICSELTRKLFVFATFATTVQKKKEQKLKLFLEEKKLPDTSKAEAMLLVKV